MINELIAQVVPFIEHYGIWGVFFLSIIEEVVAPIPSSFALLAAGFFLLPAMESTESVLIQAIVKVVIPGGLGLAIGSMFIYSLTYLGGEPFVKRWGRWFGISWNDIEKINRRFKTKHADEWIVFGLRALPIVPNILVSAVCGLIRYPVKSFFVLTFLGSAVRAFLMGMLGWSLGEAFIIYADQISEFSNQIFVGIGVFAVALFIVFFIRRKLKKSKVLSV